MTQSQRPDESIAMFAVRLEQLARQMHTAADKSSYDDVLTAQFIRGITDKQLQAALRCTPKTSFKSVVDIAIDYGNSTPRADSTPEQQLNVNYVGEPHKPQQRQWNSRQGQEKHVQFGACYACNSADHQIRERPTRHTRLQQYRNSKTIYP